MQIQSTKNKFTINKNHQKSKEKSLVKQIFGLQTNILEYNIDE